MNKALNCLLVAGALLATPVAHAQTTPFDKPGAAQQAETEAVRATVQQYFKGHATADPVEMRKAFLPTAHIEGIREGVFTSWSVDDYCAVFKGQPAKDESTRRRTIDRVDVSGNAAMVSATLVHGAVIFTDYLLLLKVNGEWKIANKIYHGAKAQ